MGFFVLFSCNKYNLGGKSIYLFNFSFCNLSTRTELEEKITKKIINFRKESF